MTSYLKTLANYELEQLFRVAQENQDGRYIKAIIDERNRRCREDE